MEKERRRDLFLTSSVGREKGKTVSSAPHGKKCMVVEHAKSLTSRNSIDFGQTLTDLSDYLAPSQACIKPVTYVPDEDDIKPDPQQLDKPSAAAAVSLDSFLCCCRYHFGSRGRFRSFKLIDHFPFFKQTEIVIGDDSGYYERGQDGEKGKKLKKAEITLNDCLACSYVFILSLTPPMPASVR